MGYGRNKRGEFGPDFGIEVKANSTAAIIAQRVVKLLATGNIKHTTGTSGRAVYGVALNGATGGGKVVYVTRLGGTVMKSTSAIPNVCGQAMTSCAAGAGNRTITVFLIPTINSGLLL